MKYNIGSVIGSNPKKLSIDFKSGLGLSQQIGSVTIECSNKELTDKLESAIKREVNKFSKKSLAIK